MLLRAKVEIGSCESQVSDMSLIVFRTASSILSKLSMKVATEEIEI